MRPLLRSSEEGADTVAWLAAAPEAVVTDGRCRLDRHPVGRTWSRTRSAPAFEAVLPVGSHHRTLEHAVPDLVAAGEAGGVLGEAPVGVGGIRRGDLLALHHQVALVHTVLPVGLEPVPGAEEQGEGQQRLDLDLRRPLPVGAVVGESGPDHRPAPRCEPQLVLGPAQPVGLAARSQGEHPVGVLHDALAGRSLLDDGDHGVVHEPSWAKRVESKVTLLNWRSKWRDSRWASEKPSYNASSSMPHSLGSTIPPTCSSPLTTSNRIGPTEASMRSAPRTLEDRTTRWSSPQRTETKASATLKLGYWPTPITANSSSSVPWTSPVPWMLK